MDLSWIYCANGLALRMPFPFSSMIIGETQETVATAVSMEVAALAVMLVYISRVKGRVTAISKYRMSKKLKLSV